MSLNTNTSTILEFKNVSKSFNDKFANKNINLKIKKNSIHAIVGENGAGKSTLMKILFGLYQPDSGELLFNSEKITVTSPTKAKQIGIGMVHQHFMLAGPMLAYQHVVLEDKSIPMFNFFKKKLFLEKLNLLSNKHEMPVPWDQPIKKLPVGIQQRIEILKLLYNNSNILILDEPTAVLTPQEIKTFFDQLKKLKESGHTILLITHKLKEVFSVADEVSVLRAGSIVFNAMINQTSISELSEKIIGRKLLDFQIDSTEKNKEVVLKINQLCINGETNGGYAANYKNKLAEINLDVKKHEIVGIAGVEGNGQSELIKAIFQPSEYKNKVTGEIYFKSNNLLKLSTKQIKDLKINYLPEDRLQQAIVENYDSSENFLLGQQRKNDFQSFGIINWKQIKKSVSNLIEQNNIKPQNPLIPLKNFSGGNQQKFVVSRELSQHPEFVLAAQPTRGVDIGAIEKIHLDLLTLRKNGCAILLISSELDELLKLCDRLYVIFDGKIVGHLLKCEFDEIKIGALMAGAKI